MRSPAWGDIPEGLGPLLSRQGVSACMTLFEDQGGERLLPQGEESSAAIHFRASCVAQGGTVPSGVP